MSARSLESVPLFAGIPCAEIISLTERTRRRTYPAKTQIVWRGDPGESLYIIQAGKVKVHSATETGSEVTLAVLGAGSWFGELCVIDKFPRSADITTLESTECLILDGSALQETVERNPNVAWYMMQHLAKRLREANDAVETLASRDVAGRIALLLLRLAEHHGQPWLSPNANVKHANAVLIPIALTKADIKSFVGATREHVTNIMSEFTRLGLITTDPPTGQFVILNPSALTERVQ